MLFSRLIALLMCCQVLVCPALCGSKHDSVAKDLESPYATIPSCPCCADHCSRPDDRQESRPDPVTPCDPPDCFCTGALILVKDISSEVELRELLISTIDVMELESRGPREVAPVTYSTSPFLYGRALLRQYCVLLV
jgi:hypothetical protein